MSVYKGSYSNKSTTIKLPNLFGASTDASDHPHNESSIIKHDHRHNLSGIKSQGITRLKKLKHMSENGIDEYATDDKDTSLPTIIEDDQDSSSPQGPFDGKEPLLTKEDETEDSDDYSDSNAVDLALTQTIGESTVSEVIPEEIVQKKELTDDEFEDHIIEKIKSRMKDTEVEIEKRLAEVETDIKKRLSETEHSIQQQKETSQQEIDSLKETEQGKINDGLDTYKAEKTDLLEQELVTMRNDMLNKLEKEKQDILEKAFSESYEKAKKEVEEKLQSQSLDLLKAINSVEKAKKDLIGKERDDVLKLAVHAAEYMTRRQLEVSEDAFDDIIKEALDRVTDKDKVILRVAKEDVERVRKKIDKFLEFMPDIKTLEVHKDAHQTPGGCIIETKLGYVDTSMDIKLEALEKAIVETYKEEHPEQFETSSPVVESESSEASAASDSATEPAPK
ncbi:hypothetical protein HOH45_03575 [bacterium]|jgi:flagellar biosynthesis/type III secretory pathway protein FliH|nr:hypothetical protein [bacterium]